MPQLRAISYPTTRKTRLKQTVKLIGDGILDAARYQPLRLHAAQLATRAPFKDYYAQVKEIYDDFLKRWRYVRDPVDLETVATTGPAVWGIVAGNYNPDPRGKGHGDCDDATVYLGAAARAIGLPVRIVTMGKPGAPKGAHSHVYPEVQIPGYGWTPVDAVAHPAPMGTTPLAGSSIIWDLFGVAVRALSGDDEPGLSVRQTTATPAERRRAKELLNPVFLSPTLWKTEDLLKLPGTPAELPALEITRRGKKRPGYKEAAEQPATTPPMLTAKPHEQKVFLLPKSTTTAATKVAPGKKTQLPPFLLPKAVVKAAAAGRKYDIFKHGSLGPPGWLGCLLGYGLTIRLISFKWLIWKAQESPWTRFSTDSASATKKYWMRLRVEPPPVVSYWGGLSPNPYQWIGNLQIGDKPFERIAGMPGVNWPVSQQAMGRVYKKWSWDDHPEWGLVSDHPLIEEMKPRADWKIKQPAWFPNEDEYLSRVKSYYYNGVAVLWAAAVYAIHARQAGKIPSWFIKHCLKWGVPFPNQHLRETRRYFSESKRFTHDKYVAPVSINGVGAGLEITNKDLEQLLKLVVHHTPVPGTVDPIPGPMHRTILDWPKDTGPMRPVDSIGTPPDWSAIIWTRMERQLSEGWQGDLSRIIPSVVSSIMSIAGGGLGASAGTAASAAAGLVGTAVGTALAAVVSSGISLCVSSALAFARTGQFSGELWRQIVQVAVAEAGSIAADKTKGLLADKVSSLENRTGWTYLEDTWGAGLEEETGALYESMKATGQEGSLRRLAGHLGV